jgi:hypothetical protein
MLPPNALDARIEQLRREGEEESLAAQGAPVPNHPGLTVRDLANALIAGAVRNGYLEDLHAGRSSPVLLEPAISRITDDEMKKLMIESSAELGLRLHQFFAEPEAFAAWLRYARSFTKRWERAAVRCELPAHGGGGAGCVGCGAPLDTTWRFCPRCGRAIQPAVG